MTRGRRTPPEKAAAAVARSLTGDASSHVGAVVGLPERTVRDLAMEVRRKNKYDWERLVADYLEADLESLAAQVRVFGDPDWIRQQPAGELAILHGVQADKAIGILAALRRPDGADPDAGEDGDARALDGPGDAEG